MLARHATHATWVLKRHRRTNLSHEVMTRIRRDLVGGTCCGGETFSYRGRSTRLRPKAARLLDTLWQADGQPVEIAEACRLVYGRPATLRAMRQTAFRASRALDRVECPLVVGCRAGRLMLLRRRCCGTG